MKQNSLIEIGSKSDIIIRFLSDININGAEYKQGEPYLYLKDVNVLVSFGETGSVTGPNESKKVNAFSNVHPTLITVGGISLSRKIYSLLACYKESESNFNPTKFISLPAEREEGEEAGIIFLTDDVGSENFFVYDEEFNKITCTYNDELNALESPLFLDGKIYLISFSSVITGTRFDFNKPHLPYMSIEIQSIGNIDKKTKRTMAFFGKVSLSSSIELNFIPNDKITIPLQFDILDGENYIYFED